MSNNAGAGELGLGTSFIIALVRAFQRTFPVHLIKGGQVNRLMISYLGG